MLFSSSIRLELLARVRHAAKRGAKCTAGTFAVEFALITPVLLMLFVVAFDVSLAMYNKVQMETATKTAVQYGLLRKPVQGDMSQIETAAQNNLPSSWFADGASDPGNVVANLNCQCTGGGTIACNQTCAGGAFRETYLTVQITKTHRTLFNYPLLADSFPLLAASTIRLQ